MTNRAQVTRQAARDGAGGHRGAELRAGLPATPLGRRTTIAVNTIAVNTIGIVSSPSPDDCWLGNPVSVGGRNADESDEDLTQAPAA